MALYSVLVALGSNVGDRMFHLSRAVGELGLAMRVVRISSVYETAAVDATPGSPDFMNLVVAGYTSLGPHKLLAQLQAIEKKLGRVRRVRNAPRTVDLDVILHSAHIVRTRELTVPHPRYRDRTFVMDPLNELHLGWVDPVKRERI